MEIRKGDSFLCIKKVKMDSGCIAYKKGYIYYSEIDCRITDIQTDIYHVWRCDSKKQKRQFKKYFIKIKK